MLFNSLGFLVFFIVVLVLYYSPVFSWKGKKGMLLFASYVFYGLWNPPLIILLWISTVVDWTAGKRLYKEDSPTKRKMWLMLSMFINLGFLAFFKYGNFLLENFTVLMNLIGLDYIAPEFDIILPMGISFYTFQTMSYTIDLYYRKAEPAKTFLDFALYVTFFPQLVAGPIVRSENLVGQFYEPKKANRDMFLWGMFLLTLGLFQKVVLADSLLASVVDDVYNSGKVLASIDAWAGTLAFSGQIFFDFAGYSTCAIGIAMMLGFNLPHNFLYPYGAIGFSDLWKRWHITLSSWLRDYLYIPMGGNKKGIVKTYIFLMITMLLGGLWHGAAWTFVIWGALHGIFLVIERLLKGAVEIKVTPVNGIWLALATYLCVNITWVFFRAADYDSAMSVLGSMLGFGPEGERILHIVDIIKTFVIILLLFSTHYAMRNSTIKKKAEMLPQFAISLVWALMLVLITIAQSSGEQFIYFQF